MAFAIEFCKKKNIGNCIDADETVKFTVFMNNMFDSLNRKYPGEGIMKNSHDIEFFMLNVCDLWSLLKYVSKFAFTCYNLSVCNLSYM